MATGHAKGILLLYLREFVTQRHGADVWSKVVAAVPVDDRQYVEGIALAGSWYPVSVWNRLLDEYLFRHHGDAHRGMRDFAMFVADRDLNTLIKMVLKIGTPEFIIKRTTWLWARYFDVGRFHAEEEAPQRWRMTLEAPKGIDECAGVLTCSAGVGPWLEKGIELSGAKGPRVQHVRCRFENAPRCEFIATWQRG